MEEQIKRAVRNLNISYIFFWVLPAFLLGAGEFELLPVGSLADNAQAVYYFDHACFEMLCAMEHCPSRHIGSRYRYQSFMLLSDA